MAYEGVDPSRLGQVNLAGDADALFLKVFSGEVLTTFEANNVMLPLSRVRTITSGKTAQFPVTGVAEAKYHTPGDSLFADEQSSGNTYLSNVKHNERTIAIDGVLTSSAFLSDIDEAKNHYEVRSIYSTEIGRQLAYTADKNLIHTVIAGARETTSRFGGSAMSGGTNTYGGAVINMGDNTNGAGNEIQISSDVVTADGSAPSASTGKSLLQALFTAAELFDSKNVPSEGRYCLLPPSQYYKLIKEETDALNRDYGNDGNGSTASGVIASVAGIRILKSNHVPSGVDLRSTIHDDAGVNNNVFGGTDGYSADFADTCGIIFQTEGVGTVKLMDLSMESEYFMDRLGTLLMAKYAMGHGVLREEACCEIILDAA